MKRVNDLDSTGANMMLQIHKRLEKEGRFLPRNLFQRFSSRLPRHDERPEIDG